MHNKLKFIRNVIYKMKRSYGLPIGYYQVVSHDVDPSTGEKTTTYRKFTINRAIVLRAREFRSFAYDLAYISANKDFTAGGFFDPEDRQIIIDASDVSSDFEPNPDDYIVFQNEKYGVSDVYHYENNSAYGFIGRKVRGEPITRIEERMSVMNLTHEVEVSIDDMLDRSVTSVLELVSEFREVP